jgi:WD40 repeat protein
LFIVLNQLFDLDQASFLLDFSNSHIKPVESFTLSSHKNSVRACVFSSGILSFEYLFDFPFKSDGRLMVSGSDDGTVKVWNVNDGRCIHTFEENLRYCDLLFFGPGKNIVVQNRFILYLLWFFI